MAASPCSASAFHRLLTQLGQAHDRELALAKAGGASSVPEHESSGPPQPLTELPEDDTPVVRQLAGRTEAVVVSPRGPSLPLRQPSWEQPAQLHPIWHVETEELNIAAGRSSGALQVAALLQRQRSAGSLSALASEGLLAKGRLLGSLGFWGRLLWDLVGMFCILADLVWMPVLICFDVELGQGDQGLEWALRVFWSADLLLKGRQATGSHCSRLEGRWAWQGSRWLLFDLLMVVLDWLPALLEGREERGSLLQLSRVPRVLRVCRVLRLAWMAKLQRFFLALGDNVLVSSEQVSLILGLLRNMLCVLLLCHLTACIWFMLGNGLGEEHWVYHHGLHGPKVPLLDKYLWAFHWVASQWTPASMEVVPRSTEERAFTVILIVGGAMMFSTFMGAITASMTRLRSISGNDLAQSFLLRHYLHENRISRSLTVRICRYAEVAVEMRRRRVDRDSVFHLSLLSQPLHLELQKEIYLPHLCRHSFFAGYADWDSAAMSQLCFAALNKEFFAKGDLLFGQGAEAPRTYCILAGTFIYERRRGVKVAPGQSRPKRSVRVPSGTWACEAALWLLWHHQGSMSALMEGEVLLVDAEKFRQVTCARESVFCRSALYARAFCRTLLDENGLAWDLPGDMMYSKFFQCGSRQPFWWQRESVAAEMAEAEWLAAHAYEECSDEESTEALEESSEDRPGLAEVWHSSWVQRGPLESENSAESSAWKAGVALPRDGEERSSELKAEVDTSRDTSEEALELDRIGKVLGKVVL